MTFYCVNEEMGIFLEDILNKLANENRSYLLKDIAITWIKIRNDKKTKSYYGYGINNNLQIYPASVVKLVYGLAMNCWIKKGILISNEEINDAVYRMLYHSSNDATSLVIDLLTGTTSGPSLEGDSWMNWKFQREIINDWLKNFQWEELNGFNCCQKTWEDRPYGRENDFYGSNGENKNQMTTDGTARIMIEIMQNIQYEADNINLKKFLFRELNKEHLKKDPNNQIVGFLGEGFPTWIPLWSKAGLMSKVRNDIVWWSDDSQSDNLLVVFGNNKNFVDDKEIFPELAQAIYKFNK